MIIHVTKRVLLSQFQHDPPAPSPALRSPVGQQWMTGMQELGALLHAILAIAHPEQYECLIQAADAVSTITPRCDDVLNIWPFPHTTVQIISNRGTPYHRDRASADSLLDFLLTMGHYGKAAVLDMKSLGISVPYGAGSVVALLSRLVSHGVPKVEDRVCYAFYTNDAILRRTGISPPKLPTVTQSLAAGSKIM